MAIVIHWSADIYHGACHTRLLVLLLLFALSFVQNRNEEKNKKSTRNRNKARKPTILLMLLFVAFSRWCYYILFLLPFLIVSNKTFSHNWNAVADIVRVLHGAAFVLNISNLLQLFMGRIRFGIATNKQKIVEIRQSGGKRESHVMSKVLQSTVSILLNQREIIESKRPFEASKERVKRVYERRMDVYKKKASTRNME